MGDYLREHRAVAALLAVAVLAVTVGGWLGWQYWQAPVVETVRLQTGPLSDYVQESGMVASRQQSSILAQVNGQVDKLTVEVGQTVDAGTVLTELSASQVDLQIKALQARLAQVQALDSGLRNPADEVIANAELAVETARRQAVLLAEEFVKTETLYNEGAVSSSAYRAAQHASQAADGALAMAENDLQLLMRGGSDAMRQQYSAQISEIHYNIAQLEDMRGNYAVKAPISGTVVEVMIHEGDTVFAGYPLIRIADLEDLYVAGDILAEKSYRLGVGNAVELRSGSPVEVGAMTLSKIYPTAQVQISNLGIEQKRVPFEVDFLVGSGSLRLGSELDLRIVTETREAVTYLPEEAVYTREGKTYVLVREGRRALEREVESGFTTPDAVEIVSGLAAEDEVIVTRSSDIRDGALVR